LLERLVAGLCPLLFGWARRSPGRRLRHLSQSLVGSTRPRVDHELGVAEPPSWDVARPLGRVRGLVRLFTPTVSTGCWGEERGTHSGPRLPGVALFAPLVGLSPTTQESGSGQLPHGAAPEGNHRIGVTFLFTITTAVSSELRLAAAGSGTFTRSVSSPSSRAARRLQAHR